MFVCYLAFYWKWINSEPEAWMSRINAHNESMLSHRCGYPEPKVSKIFVENSIEHEPIVSRRCDSSSSMISFTNTDKNKPVLSWRYDCSDSMWNEPSLSRTHACPESIISFRRADPQQEAATAVHACMTKRNPSFSSIQSNPFFSKQKQPHRQQPRALFLKINRPEGPIRNTEPQQHLKIQ